MIKWLLRFVRLVLFFMGVIFVAFWAWVMWDEYTEPPVNPKMIEIPRITKP